MDEKEPKEALSGHDGGALSALVQRRTEESPPGLKGAFCQHGCLEELRKLLQFSGVCDYEIFQLWIVESKSQ